VAVIDRASRNPPSPFTGPVVQYLDSPGKTPQRTLPAMLFTVRRRAFSTSSQLYLSRQIFLIGTQQEMPAYRLRLRNYGAAIVLALSLVATATAEKSKDLGVASSAVHVDNFGKINANYF